MHFPVFTHKHLEKYPNVQVNVPPRNVMELCPKGGKSWQNVTGDRRDLCEQAVDKIRRKITRRRMAIKPAFRDYDKHNNGHVSRSQMRQCFITYGILLSDEELFALEQRFNDDVGFNYFWFLKEVEATKLEAPLVSTLNKISHIKNDFSYMGYGLIFLQKNTECYIQSRE